MVGFVLRVMNFFYWVFLFLAGLVSLCCGSNGGGGVYSSGGVLVINGSSAIAKTDEVFVCATLDWWPPEKCDYGTCSWGLASLLNLNLSSPILLNAVKAFSPIKLRLGGSLQDKVIYDTGDPRQPCTSFVKNNSEMFGFSQGCLPLTRWDKLNDFFRKAGAEIIFGLNALNGRVPLPDGSLGGPWNWTNAASFMRYTVNKGYAIHGWELGNELSGTGVGARVDADQYAADVKSLKYIVDNMYEGFPVKPLVLAPGGFFDANWFSELIDKTKPDYMDALTHHIYNLGPGVDDHLIQKILDPSYLDGEATTFKNLQNIIQSTGTTATAWVGEAGGAYNSGRNLVSNTFVYSFWYLDQLGMSSSYDTKTYCRQSLVGGNYGLLNTTNFKPNPDYYSALLWHRLMGTKVLATDFNGSKKMRAYAHCAKESPGITLLLINLDGNTTTQVYVTSESSYIKSLRHHRSSVRARFSHIHRPRKDVVFTRDEYHLTPKDGNLQSQTMLLNGNALNVDIYGNIPPLEPMKIESSLPVTVAPYSIVFAHIPHFDAPVCR